MEYIEKHRPAWLDQQAGRRWRRNVYVAPTIHNGLGVFARKPFVVGDRVLVFRGPRKRREDFSNLFEWEHSLQIDLDIYLGPSGGEDDFVNHSCNPNTYLRGRQLLVAFRPISLNEEITVDYATLTEEPGWQMKCYCGAFNCRGMVRSFSQTPIHIWREPHYQTWLAKLKHPKIKNTLRFFHHPCHSG